MSFDNLQILDRLDTVLDAPAALAERKNATREEMGFEGIEVRDDSSHEQTGEKARTACNEVSDTFNTVVVLATENLKPNYATGAVLKVSEISSSEREAVLVSTSFDDMPAKNRQGMAPESQTSAAGWTEAD